MDHQLITHAVKRDIFHGCVVQASVSDLILFLDVALAGGDLRAILLPPVIERTPA